jgi:hypothetical protein
MESAIVDAICFMRLFAGESAKVLRGQERNSANGNIAASRRLNQLTIESPVAQGSGRKPEHSGIFGIPVGFRSISASESPFAGIPEPEWPEPTGTFRRPWN